MDGRLVRCESAGRYTFARMSKRVLLLASALIVGIASWGGPIHAQPAKTGFALTVDSIMRGPDLVGYPPASLRWSADSQKLFFEWRRPGEDEASTYVVGRDGGAPVKLSGNASDEALPRDAMLMELGRAYAAGGKKTEAKQTFDKVVKEFPDSPFVDEAKSQLAALT